MDEEKREYNLNVGKAIDVLRHDVPDILSQVSLLSLSTPALVLFPQRDREEEK